MTIELDERRRTKGAGFALGAGLVLQLAAIAAVVQASGAIEQHLREVYEPYKPGQVDQAGSLVVTYLLTLGALGVVGWLVTAWAHRRGLRWTRPLAVTLLVLGTVLAVTNLVVTEYGSRLIPAWPGAAGLLPSLAGVVAVVMLFRER